MSETLSRIPTGMRYYWGSEARLRRAIENTLVSIFDGWLYEEITTPTVDYYSLFEHGMGRLQAHHAFRFTDTDAACWRLDLTLPLWSPVPQPLFSPTVSD